MDQTDDGRRKLYIIDADFDHISGRQKPRLKHLYRVRGYCIENLILHPASVVEVGFNYSASMSRQQVANCIDYATIVGTKEPLLRSLFVVYAASQELSAGVQTIKYSVHRLLSPVAGVSHFDEQKLRKRIIDVVRSSARVVGAAAFSRIRKAFYNRSLGLELDMFVSGKDYLLPVIHQRLRSCGYTGSIDQLKVHLARECKPIYEPWLARRLNKI